MDTYRSADSFSPTQQRARHSLRQWRALTAHAVDDKDSGVHAQTFLSVNVFRSTQEALAGLQTSFIGRVGMFAPTRLLRSTLHVDRRAGIGVYAKSIVRAVAFRGGHLRKLTGCSSYSTQCNATAAAVERPH